MPEIPFTFLHRRSLVSGFRPDDLKTGEIYIQQADNTILFKNDLGNLVCTITSDQSGDFATLDGSNYLSTSQIPNVTGDVCINAGSNVSTVYKIQGYPVANTQPANGQTLQFDGSSWVPGDIAAGGNGGGGLIYYFNNSIPADLPTGNLPASLSGSFELGRSGTVSGYSVTKTDLSQVSYDPLVGFVSDVLDPNVNAIPAGLFDFNIWASSNSTTQTVLQLKVYKYDGAATTSTLLATSDDVYTYDGAVTAQYIMSVVLPQTSLSSTDRLFILFSAKGLANNKDVTLYFGGNTPSHVHTTVPSVGGSGLVKVINGVMQNTASALVNADVSATAAIAGSKIESGFFALASATGRFATTGQIYCNQNVVLTRGTYTIHSTAACSAMLGGSLNTLMGTWNASLGGYSNTISGSVTSSVGGCGNLIEGNFGGVFNGASNRTCINSFYSTIVGGISNVADGSYSVVLGGAGNTINSTASSPVQNSAIVGGCLHRMSGWNSFVAGGHTNVLCASSTSAIIGGSSNLINGSNYSNSDSLILGGVSNFNSGNRSAVLASTSSTIEASSINSLVAASALSRVSGINSVVAGGCGNIIQSYNCNSAIVGGYLNCITGFAVNSVILGGQSIVATGQNFVYGMNFCSCNGAFFGNACGLTGLATGSLTGVFVRNTQTGSFITTGQTGAFGGGSVNTGSFVTTGQICNGTNIVITRASCTVYSNANCSVLIGGTSNSISNSLNASIAGSQNAVDGCRSVILGGGSNNIYSWNLGGAPTLNSAIIAGGSGIISGYNSAVVGGTSNQVFSSNNSATFGGSCNSIYGRFIDYVFNPSTFQMDPVICDYFTDTSVILGGFFNCVQLSSRSAILGGCSNFVTQSSNSTVLSTVCSSVVGNQSVVAGGSGNGINSSSNTAIIGGSLNRICASANNSIILGGQFITGTGVNFVYGMNFCSCNGAFYGNGAGLTGLATGSFITTSQTGVFALAANTGSFVTTGQTGVFALAANTGSFVTSGQTGTLCINNLCVNGGYISVGGIEENFTTCATGACGLINFDVCAAATMYYICNSTANFGLNLRSNSSTALNSILDANKTLTVTFLNTNGSTAYALTGVSIDGSGRSIRWLNGSGTFPAGNTGSIDSYSITAIKTGDNLYTVLGSQGRFA